MMREVQVDIGVTAAELADLARRVHGLVDVISIDGCWKFATIILERAIDPEAVAECILRQARSTMTLHMVASLMSEGERVGA